MSIHDARMCMRKRSQPASPPLSQSYFFFLLDVSRFAIPFEMLDWFWAFLSESWHFGTFFRLHIRLVRMFAGRMLQEKVSSGGKESLRSGSGLVACPLQSRC